MKTTGYKTAQRLDTHPVCLWQCLPASVIGMTFFLPTLKKTKNEVPGGNGSTSHLGLIWDIPFFFKIIAINYETKSAEYSSDEQSLIFHQRKTDTVKSTMIKMPK